MAVIPTGFGQANFRFTGPGAPTGAEVTLGFENSGDQFASDICDLLIANWVATILTEQCNQVELSSVYVKLGPNTTGAFAEVADGTAGSIVSASEVPNVALLVSKTTAQGGRQGRGRMFIPGVRESDFDSSGLMSPTDVAGWQTDLDSFKTNLDGDLLGPVLLRSESSPPGSPIPVTSFAVSGKAATQRRRLRR